MKKIARIVTVVALCTVAALAFAACGGSSSGAAANSQGASQGASSVEAVEPAYVVSKMTMYQDGKETATIEYEVNESGSVTESTTIANGETRVTKASDFNELGYATKSSNDNGESTNEFTIENGQVVKQVTTFKGNDGQTSTYTIEYAYHDNGMLKSRITDDQNRVASQSYDENGYITESSNEPKAEDIIGSTMSYTWEMDANGVPTSVTQEVKASDSSSEAGAATKTMKVECDEAGNLVKRYNEDGSLAVEYEYVKIDNPNKMIQSQPKMF